MPEGNDGPSPDDVDILLSVYLNSIMNFSRQLSSVLLTPRLRLPLRLELIPRPNELGRDVAILNLRRGHPLPPRRAPKIDNVEVIPFSAIIEGYRATERKRAVVLQLRLEDGLMIANGHEFRRVRSQPYRAAGGGARDEPHVHDVERSQSQGFEHPPGEEDEVVRRSEVDGPPDGAGQGRRRGVVMLVGGEGNAGGGYALDAGYLEQPRHLCVCSATTCVRGSFRHTVMKEGGGTKRVSYTRAWEIRSRTRSIHRIRQRCATAACRKKCARQGYRPPLARVDAQRNGIPTTTPHSPHASMNDTRPTTNWTDLGLAPDDGVPEVARQAHLVSGVDVSVAEYAGGGIEQSVVQRQRDAPAVAHHVGGARRRGDYLGIVILHGLLQEREGRGAIPLPPEVRQYPAIATQEEARRRGGIARGGVVVEGGRLGGGGLRERRRRRRRRRRRCCGGGGVGGWESYDDGQ